MNTPQDEIADLLDRLMFTVKVLVTSGLNDKQRIANAYQNARTLATTINLDDKHSRWNSG